MEAKNLKVKYYEEGKGKHLHVPSLHSLYNYVHNREVPLKNQDANKEYIKVICVFKFLIKISLLLLE